MHAHAVVQGSAEQSCAHLSSGVFYCLVKIKTDKHVKFCTDCIVQQNGSMNSNEAHGKHDELPTLQCDDGDGERTSSSESLPLPHEPDAIYLCAKRCVCCAVPRFPYCVNSVDAVVAEVAEMLFCCAARRTRNPVFTDTLTVDVARKLASVLFASLQACFYFFIPSNHRTVLPLFCLVATSPGSNPGQFLKFLPQLFFHSAVLLLFVVIAFCTLRFN